MFALTTPSWELPWARDPPGVSVTPCRSPRHPGSAGPIVSSLSMTCVLRNSVLVTLGLALCAFQSCPTLCNPMNCNPPGSCLWEFPKQEYWSGLLFPSPGDFPDSGIEPGSPTLQADSLPSEPSPAQAHTRCSENISADALTDRNLMKDKVTTTCFPNKSLKELFKDYFCRNNALFLSDYFHLAC